MLSIEGWILCGSALFVFSIGLNSVEFGGWWNLVNLEDGALIVLMPFYCGQDIFCQFVLHWLFCEIRPDRLVLAPHRHEWALAAHAPVYNYNYSIELILCISVL